MTKTLATSLVLVAACSGGSPRQSAEVEGSLALDGAPRVVTRCEVRQAARSVDVDLHLSGGAVVTYAEASHHVLVDGQRTPCTGGSASNIMWGTGAAGPFFHGGLRLECQRVTADLTLHCGVLDEATRARIEGEIEKAREGAE